MSRRKLSLLLLAALLLFLLFAWYDGGRKPVRLIEQPADLPEGLP